MSGLVNKVKEVLHSDKNKHHDNNVPEGTAGPHSSRAANAADPRVDSDLDGSHRNTGTSGLGHTGAHTTGTHTSGLGHTGAAGGYGSGPAHNTAGPHKSDALNKADPRVDSDLDGSRTAGGAGYGTSGTHTSGLGHTGAAGGYGSGPAHHTAGPHKSDALNKADPRVDSDLDGSRTAGGAGYGTSGHTGTSGLTGAGTHNTHQGAYGTGAGLSGTHGSSGLTGSHQPITGHNDPTGTHGPHSSRVANAADPRVDSDRDGSRTAGGAGYGTTGHTGTHTGTHTGAHTGLGSGPAPNTAGPHKSDVLNKLDPRVDSDRDGSKTVGNDNNQTYRS